MTMPETGGQAQFDEAGTLIAGRYQLTRLIARGGMGEVFAALDRSTGQSVALKRLLPSVAAQRGVVVHFMREFHALSQLRHPRIIEVYDYGFDHELPYYTMELLDGRDLRDLSPLPYRQACLYLRDVASSLALLHARRLLHRDVSPRNVRCTSDGRCKLIDFGAMIPFGVPPNVIGTAPCIPPEAVHGASLDQRSDLFALGALAYFVLTGRYGYAASEIDQLPGAWQSRLVRPNEHVPGLPDALDELVMSLLRLNPGLRPGSAAEVIEWLSAIGELAPDDSVDVARSFLASTYVCGRAPIIAELTRHIGRSVGGSGSSVLIHGAAGSGKSRMLAEAALLGQTRGMSVVRVVARRQRGSAYALAHDMIAALRHIAPLEAAAAGADDVAWPRARLSMSSLLPEPAGDDASELRARSQQHLTELFCRVAQIKPLLLIVDDLERADDFSASLLAGLARQSTKLPILIVASRSGEPAPSKAALGLQDTAQHVRLEPLTRNDSDELVRAMFGDARNIDRLAEWMFRVARGNPKLAMALGEHLMHRGLVRYVDGTWVLPSDELHEGVPGDMAQAWALRIQTLSPAAMELAELLCVRRGGADAALCLAAGAASAEQVFAALDELVREGVLESAGEEYVFPHDDLRKTLQRGLSAERAGALHQRWADIMLTDAACDVDARLEAGWHLIHTQDELRGADLLAEVAPVLVEQGLAMDTAIPALEKALEVYERRRRPLDVRLRLRSTLVLAGYLYDYRLAARYGAETLAELHEISGLRLATRLSPVLGKRIALLVAMLAVTLRRPWLPRERRGPTIFTALLYFVRSAMGLLGVRAVSLDAPGTSAILALLAPLEAAPPFTSGRLIYLFCRAVALQSQGRAGEQSRALDAAERELTRGRKNDMSELEYRSLLVGLLTAQGNSECYRERSQALQHADRLDTIGTRQARAAALQIRMTYALYRGDNERAEQYRRLLDLHAIQGGKTWQVEWFSTTSEGHAGAIWSDLVMMRRSLDRLEHLTKEVPSLATPRDTIQIWHCFRREEFALAAELGMRFAAMYPPQSIGGWAPTYAVTAFALIELGRAEEARALCERGLATLDESAGAYFLMYGLLEVALATALALLGERARADQLMHARVERLRAQGEHEHLVIMYEYQARMARLVGDRDALARALDAMRDAAQSSRSAAVILLAERVAQAHAKHRAAPPTAADASMTDARRAARANAPEPRTQTALSTFLRGCDSGNERQRQILRVLAGWLAADEAYLYGRCGDDLQLLAAISDSAAPSELSQRVREALLDPRLASLVIDTEAHDRSGAEPNVLRYRVQCLYGDGESEGAIGAVAVREWEELRDAVPDAVIEEMGRALSDDLRAEDASQACTIASAKHASNRRAFDAEPKSSGS